MTTPAGQRDVFLLLENPTRTDDTQGGYTEAWAPLDPPNAWAAVERANQRNLERIVSNTQTATASHIVTMPYHPQVTTQTRLTWVDRFKAIHVVQVTDVQDVEGRGSELLLLGSEIVQ